MSLQGTLKTLGIAELLEFLSNRDATGQLDVHTSAGTATYLFFEGRVAQSEYSFARESGTDCATATYLILSELDGTFLFDAEQEPIDVDRCEEVSSLLSRTADTAEKWLAIEAVIPTPEHVLIRNEELDGSVTIQPVWWKALEAIGSGSSSYSVAQSLGMGLLDASLLLLAMADSGLLRVIGAATVGTQPLSNEARVLKRDAEHQNTSQEMQEPGQPIASLFSGETVTAFADETADVPYAEVGMEDASPVIPSALEIGEPAPLVGDSIPGIALADPGAGPLVLNPTSPEPIAATPIDRFVGVENNSLEPNDFAVPNPLAIEGASPVVESLLIAPVEQGEEASITIEDDLEGAQWPIIPPEVPQPTPEDQNATGSESWGLAGTYHETPATESTYASGNAFGPEGNTGASKPDNDLLGEFGGLIHDEDEDRNSVIKFLRRD